MLVNDNAAATKEKSSNDTEGKPSKLHAPRGTPKDSLVSRTAGALFFASPHFGGCYLLPWRLPSTANAIAITSSQAPPFQTPFPRCIPWVGLWALPQWFTNYRKRTPGSRNLALSSAVWLKSVGLPSAALPYLTWHSLPYYNTFGLRESDGFRVLNLGEGKTTEVSYMWKTKVSERLQRFIVNLANYGLLRLAQVVPPTSACGQCGEYVGLKGSDHIDICKPGEARPCDMICHPLMFRSNVPLQPIPRICATS